MLTAPRNVKWLKNTNKHKQYVLPDGRHVFEMLDHGGFIHISVYVRDKHGALWLRMENKYDKRNTWTERYIFLAQELAHKVYSDPHKRMDEFERNIDQLLEKRNQAGTV